MTRPSVGFLFSLNGEALSERVGLFIEGCNGTAIQLLCSVKMYIP